MVMTVIDAIYIYYTRWYSISDDDIYSLTTGNPDWRIVCVFVTDAIHDILSHIPMPDTVDDPPVLACLPYSGDISCVSVFSILFLSLPPIPVIRWLPTAIFRVWYYSWYLIHIHPAVVTIRYRLSAMKWCSIPMIPPVFGNAIPDDLDDYYLFQYSDDRLTDACFICPIRITTTVNCREEIYLTTIGEMTWYSLMIFIDTVLFSRPIHCLMTSLPYILWYYDDSPWLHSLYSGHLSDYRVSCRWLSDLILLGCHSAMYWPYWPFWPIDCNCYFVLLISERSPILFHRWWPIRWLWLTLVTSAVTLRGVSPVLRSSMRWYILHSTSILPVLLWWWCWYTAPCLFTTLLYSVLLSRYLVTTVQYSLDTLPHYLHWRLMMTSTDLWRRWLRYTHLCSAFPIHPTSPTLRYWYDDTVVILPPAPTDLFAIRYISMIPRIIICSSLYSIWCPWPFDDTAIIIYY